MTERRGSIRHAVSAVPVSISTVDRNDRVGMIEDESNGGVLFRSRSRNELNERITVLFELHASQHMASGTVVRTSLATEDGAFFQQLTGVRFEKPIEVPRA